MRRRLSILVAATTSAVVLAFVIPLIVMVRTVAEDHAIGLATIEAQGLATVAATAEPDSRRRNSELYIADARFGPTLTVLLPDGAQIGTPIPADDAGLRFALQGQSTVQKLDGGAAVYTVVLLDGGTVVARAVVPASQFHEGTARATLTITLLGLVLMAGSVFAADRLARRFSAPVLAVTEAAQQMSRGALDTRVEVEPTAMPELVALAGALNGLAERVHELVASERDAVADLSHRLRTPVTALRLDAEGVADPEVAERLRGHLGALERTVDAVVHEARRPARTSGPAACDVAATVGERVQFWSALAEDQGRQLALLMPGGPVRARLHAEDLADAVDILLDNVFAHAGDGVQARVTVARRSGGGVTVTVEDAGSGLPGSDVVHRGTSGSGSSGLGLDIVRRTALASGGTLELGRSPLGGALVRLVLGSAP